MKIWAMGSCHGSPNNKISTHFPDPISSFVFASVKVRLDCQLGWPQNQRRGPWEGLWGHFQRGLAEEGTSLFRMGCTLLNMLSSKRVWGESSAVRWSVSVSGCFCVCSVVLPRSLGIITPPTPLGPSTNWRSVILQETSSLWPLRHPAYRTKEIVGSQPF